MKRIRPFSLRHPAFFCFGIASLFVMPQFCQAHVTNVVSLNPPVQLGGFLIPAPLTAADNQLVGAGYVFEEQNDIVLGVPLQTDTNGFGHGIPGAYQTSSSGILQTGVIPAGTVVSSFMIHFDVLDGSFPDSAAFKVFTDEHIIGAIFSDNLLDASDLIVGAPGTSYAHGVALRGATVDPTEGMDVVIGVPGDLDPGVGFSNTVTVFSLEVGASLDEVRIITSPVPEPTSGTLALLAGLFGMTGLRHRSQ